LASRGFVRGHLVVVVSADEDDNSSGNTMLTSVLTPALSHQAVDTPLTHYSLTRYLCQVLGIPNLGNAATASDLEDAFGLVGLRPGPPDGRRRSSPAGRLGPPGHVVPGPRG
jgi:hypothetical protein